MADIDNENLEKAISGSGSQNNQNSQQQNPQQNQQQTSSQGGQGGKQMSQDMEIGFHQGALNTLNKERSELLKMAQNVESIMQMHAKRLQELGVDIQFQQNQNQEQQNQDKEQQREKQ